jgi:hypothetical protein
MRKARILICLLLLVACLTPTMPAFALVNPASYTITLQTPSVFRNIAQSGDRLYVFEYDIEPTGNISSTPASTSVFFNLLADDGVTVKIQTKPYVYPYFLNNGYKKGIGSFYFAPTDNMTGIAWGSATASIQVGGWPAFYDPVWSITLPLSGANYDASTSQSINQADFKNWVLLECDKLNADYSGVFAQPLKTTSDSGIILSPYGELLFEGAIPGIKNLNPSLFFYQVYVPTRMPTVPYNMSEANNRATAFSHSDWYHGFQVMGSGVGLGAEATETIVFMIMMIIACIWTARKDWGVEPGIGLSALIGTGSAFMTGSTLYTLMMVAALIAVAAIMYLIFLKKA